MLGAIPKLTDEAISPNTLAIFPPVRNNSPDTLPTVLSCCLKSNALSRDVPNALANSEASLSNSLNRFINPITTAVKPPTIRSVKVRDLTRLEPNSFNNLPAIEKPLAAPLLASINFFVLVIASSIPRASASLPKPALVKPLPIPSTVAPNTPTFY